MPYGGPCLVSLPALNFMGHVCQLGEYRTQAREKRYLACEETTRGTGKEVSCPADELNLTI